MLWKVPCLSDCPSDVRSSHFHERSPHMAIRSLDARPLSVRPRVLSVASNGLRLSARSPHCSDGAFAQSQCLGPPSAAISGLLGLDAALL